MEIIAFSITMVLGSYIFLQCTYLYRKYMMHRTEKNLIMNGVKPTPGEVSHGMIVTKDRKGVQSVTTKNAAWYNKLF